MLLLEEGRIEVLSPVAEEVERGHQDDEVERDLPMTDKLHHRVDVRAAAPLLEHRAFLHVHADKEDEQRGRDPDHEHAAPADRVEEQEIDEAGDEIARRIAALQQAETGPRRRAGIDSMTRLAPRPHSPPIPTPKRKRSINRLVSVGAKPEANSKIEKKMMSAISTGRRPKRSPSQPKQKAPIGRAASVRKTPCATAFTSVPNSFEIAESMKTMRKKSKASSVQPR